MPATGRLDGQVAIVTGSARGIGAAIVRRFLEEGARVLGGDNAAAQPGLDDLAGHDRLVLRRLDVRDASDWRQAVQAAEDRFGPVNVLVNNAAIVRYGGLRDLSPDELREQVEVNTIGAFNGMQAVLGPMGRAGRGSIVNVCSLVGLFGSTKAAGYAASKWALRGLTKSAALELGPAGIRVNALHPGRVDTAIHAEGQPEERVAPVGRRGLVWDMANAAVYLASAESAYVNGSDQVVDGGQHAGCLELQQPG